MDLSAGRCLFQKRNERIDWRKLAAVDIEKIAREVDVDAIQENILNVTYCNVEQELGYNGLDANVIKLFRLAQLTIEYLLHSQEFLQQCLNEKDKKLETFNEQLNISLSECGGIKEELSKRNESYKGLKKELQKAKKLIGDYQLMVRAGASGLHRCASCTKSFVSEYYLRSHVERRHPGDVKRTSPQQLPSQSVLHDETFYNDLNEIKLRLKTTEEELKREHETVFQLNQQESKRSQEMLEILKRHEAWKNEEQEQMKAEMEGYKTMMVKELKETQRENEVLKGNVHVLQQSTDQWRKSALGNLEDDNETSKIQYNDLNAQIEQLSQQLVDTRKENEEVKKSSEKWKVASRSLIEDENKCKELNVKVQKMESHFKKEFDRLHNKYQSDLEEAKELCNEHARNVKEENLLRSTLHMQDEADSGKPLDNLQAVNEEPDGSSVFWVALNLSITNCYRVSQKTASAAGDWKDSFSFRAFLTPVDLFEKPIHVYTCAGSPYWRQYISLSDKPPSPNYKKELTFYTADQKLMGTVKLYILDTGSGIVTRSMISKKESVEGWKEKHAYFFVLKAGMLRDSFNKSGTVNNSEVFRSVSDDEVSLSSLTGTDLVRGNLADALKESRENLVDTNKDEGNKTTDKVEDFVNESDSESEILDEHENKAETVHHELENDNDKFGGTESSSFLGATLPEKGEFFPFPNNQLAVARYNHTHDMVNAQREEMLKILEDNLIKRGIDVDEEQMMSSIFKSKMKNHEKEVNLIEKQYHGCSEKRKRLSQSIHDYAASNFSKKKKVSSSKKWKSVETVVKAAVRFQDEVTPIREHSITSPTSDSFSPVPDVVNTFQATTSTPKEKQSTVVDNKSIGVSDSDSESWNSEELENKILESHDTKKKIDTVINDTLLDDFDSSGSTHQLSWQKKPVIKLTNDNEEFQVSDSSEWDSDELSVKHLHDSPNDALRISTTLEDDDSFEQYQPYNPKLLPPRGEKVKELASSLELALGSRDSSKKKPAGGVDIVNM